MIYNHFTFVRKCKKFLKICNCRGEIDASIQQIYWKKDKYALGTR